MSYVVNWRAVDGTPGWHSVADLGAAAAHVEYLRNADGVDGAKIFRLEEVPFELRAYFRVELADSTPGPPPSAAPEFAPEPDPTGVVEAATDPSKPVHADESWSDSGWHETDTGTDAVDGPAEDASLEPAADGGTNGAQRRGLFGR